MKLAMFSHQGKTCLGTLEGDSVKNLTAAGIAGSIEDIIAGGAQALRKAQTAAEGATSLTRSDVQLLAPIKPGKVLCSGVNYKGHADENPNAVLPKEPFFFAKLPSSITGPEANVVKSPRTEQLDYEVELAVVIGERLFKADPAEVMPAIFGYTLLNDISARDVQFKDNQITLGKNFAGFAPIGPCIVTSDEMTNPDSVRLLARLNGKVLQDGTTGDWLFSLPNLLSFLSQIMPLEPGDIVTTGTPAGVGVFQNPPVFMNAGDVIEIEAEGIGILRNTIVAP